MAEEKKKKTVSRNTFLMLIILLLLSFMGNLFLLNEKIRSMQKLEENRVQIDTLAGLRAALEMELEKARAELNNYIGQNQDLDSLLSIANIQLEEQKQRINELFSQNMSYAAIRKKLEAELDELRKFKSVYLVKVDSLVGLSTALTASNVRLTRDLRALESEREVLTEKVALGSVLKARNLLITAFRKKGSGKLAETTSSKKASVIRACFELDENPISEMNKKDIILKITSPKGVVLYKESAGSGIFNAADTKEESKYTLLKYIDYNRTKQNICMDWTQENALESGKYKVEVYCEGYPSGNGSIELK